MFEATEKYDGFRLNHSDFADVSKTVYKKNKIINVVKQADVCYLELDGVDVLVPAFYHCGKRSKLLDEFVLEDGVNAFYEFKDDDPPEVIVSYIDDKPIAVIGFADHKPRFCCVDPILEECESFPWTESGSNSFADWRQSSNAYEDNVSNCSGGVRGVAKANARYEMFDGVVQLRGDMSVSVTGCDIPYHCGGPIDGCGCHAIARIFEEVNVKEIGEKQGIPYRMDSTIILNYDTDLPLPPYRCGWVEIRVELGDTRFYLHTVREGHRGTHYPMNEKIEIPIGGSPYDLIRKIKFRASISTGRSQEMNCGCWPKISGCVGLKYLCIKPSPETIRNIV